jgi:hypothetical protein
VSRSLDPLKVRLRDPLTATHCVPGLLVVSVVLAGADSRARGPGSRLGIADRAAAPEAAWRRDAGAWTMEDEKNG